MPHIINIIISLKNFTNAVRTIAYSRSYNLGMTICRQDSCASTSVLLSYYCEMKSNHGSLVKGKLLEQRFSTGSGDFEWQGQTPDTPILREVCHALHASLTIVYTRVSCLLAPDALLKPLPISTLIEFIHRLTLRTQRKRLTYPTYPDLFFFPFQISVYVFLFFFLLTHCLYRCPILSNIQSP